MEQGIGWLRWSPDDFWGATLAELTAGVMGYLETRGQKRPEPKAAQYDALLEMAAQARRAERRAERERKQ